jgi:hypothetical protein
MFDYKNARMNNKRCDTIDNHQTLIVPTDRYLHRHSFLITFFPLILTGSCFKALRKALHMSFKNILHETII